MNLHNESEITSVLKRGDDPACGPGLPLYRDEDHCLYVDDSGHHTIIREADSHHKACCLTAPYVQSCFRHNESVLFAGRREDLVYEQMMGNLPPGQQMICVDYSSPRSSPNGFNILELPFLMMQSSDPNDHVEAARLLECFLDSVISRESCWNDQTGVYTAARDLIMGLALCMIQHCEREQVNLMNLLRMAQQLDQEEESQRVDDLLEELSYVDHTQYQGFMHNYFTSSEEKKALIQYCAVQALNQFCGGPEMQEFIQAGDEAWSAAKLDIHEPFYLCVVFPDEDDVHKQAGALISQLAFYLKEQAERCGYMEWKTHIHMVICGAGNLFIPVLPRLAEGIQHNLFKLTLVVQNEVVQLERLYGRQGLEIIEHAQTAVYFARNDHSMQEKRDRDGERMLVSVNGLRQLQYLSRMPVCSFARAADKLPAAPRHPASKILIGELIQHLKELNGMWSEADFEEAMHMLSMEAETALDRLIDECVQLAEADQDEEVSNKIEEFLKGSDPAPEQIFDDDDFDAVDMDLSELEGPSCCWLVVHSVGYGWEFTLTQLSRKAERIENCEHGPIRYLMDCADASALRTRIQCMGGSAEIQLLYE